MDQSNYGLIVTSNNVSAQNAKTAQKLLTANTPLMKLDRLNVVSFQNIRIFLSKEPTNPAIGTSTTITTLLYSFPHNYVYTPEVWSLCRADGVTINGNTGSTYFVDKGLIGGVGTSTNVANAYVYVTADATNIYIYVDRFTGTVGPQIFLAGGALNYRIYIFVDDLQNTI